MAGALALLAFAAATLACHLPQHASPRGPAGACVNLSYTFYRIAEERNRGATREAQIASARARLRSPERDEALRQLLQIIDLVYRFSDANAPEIGATVLDNCSVDARGQVVVQTLWPTR